MVKHQISYVVLYRVSLPILNVLFYPADEFKTHHLHNELWELGKNRWDWEARYIHEEYANMFVENANFSQPCPDVYWFPIVTERFADELVAEMENYGKWSDGSNSVSTNIV